MEKHLFKAIFLLIVMFFHSFVLVPKAHATAFESTIARIGFRAIAPSAIAAMGAGSGAIIGVALGAGVGYIILKSGAITALKNWWNSNMSYPAPSGVNGTEYATITGTYPSVKFMTYSNLNSGKYWGYGYYYTGSGYGQQSVIYGCVAAGCTGHADAISAKAHAYILLKQHGIGTNFNGNGTWSHWNTTEYVPTIPGDFGTQLDTFGPPVFSDGTVKASPGAMAALSGGASIISVQTNVSDPDLDMFIAGSGSTAVDTDAGTQAGTPPSTTDNTVTAGDTASIGILQQISNFVSNLLGIKTSTEAIKTALDNSLIIQSQMSAKLDNVGSFPQSAQNALDNIAVGTQIMVSEIDQIGNKVEHMDNTLIQANATLGSVQTRIESLKIAASTKFPFSLVSSIGLSAVSGTSTYVFADLPLTSSISIPISPMSGPLATLFAWIRQLLVWFFWVGTLLAILRKGMEM